LKKISTAKFLSVFVGSQRVEEDQWEGRDSFTLNSDTKKASIFCRRQIFVLSQTTAKLVLTAGLRFLVGWPSADIYLVSFPANESDLKTCTNQRSQSRDRGLKCQSQKILQQKE
jgi:hypothetical protein